MARQKISRIFVFFSCLLFLVAIGSASPLASQSAGSGNATTAGSGGAQPFTTGFFIPAEGSIHSSQINTLLKGPGGSVIFGTSFGLSTYNGTWKTLHIHRENFSEGLLNDYITSAAIDSSGNLWIGYSGGLQIFNWKTYQTIRDQQLLKDPRVTNILRWDDAMWFTTGNAGVHRYENGKWTWFQPMTPGGPGFFTATGMVHDTVGNGTLIFATSNEGEWIVRSPFDPIRFERLDSGEDIFHPLSQVRQDPHGGAYFFNASTIIHYSAASGFDTVVTMDKITSMPLSINDLVAADDGKIYIATDNGIYIWDDGAVYRHISSFDGIGPSSIVKSIFIDGEGRVWFGTQGYVGYYRENPDANPLIEVRTVSPTTVPTRAPVVMSATIAIPTPTIQAEPTGPASVQDLLSSIIDPVAKAVNAVIGKITGKSG